MKSVLIVNGVVFQSHSSAPSVTPDDDVFKHLALTYSTNHPVMKRGVACKAGTPAFNRGITNGAEWYPLTGGMQDFNYVWYGCMEVTLELSCCKYPPASELPKFWEENRLALVKFLAEAHRGVHGFVMDEHGNPIEKASLKVKGRDVGFVTTKYGEFWRILLPGVYTLEVYAQGYLPRETEVLVVEQHPTLLNITLYRNQVRVVTVTSEPPTRPPAPTLPSQTTRIIWDVMGSWRQWYGVGDGEGDDDGQSDLRGSGGGDRGEIGADDVVTVAPISGASHRDTCPLLVVAVVMVMLGDTT